MGVTAVRSTGRSNFRIINALNAEWSLLTQSQGIPVCGWAGRHLALASCLTLADVLAAVRDDPDGVLGALLLEHAQGDDLAGRTVLQAMLGKIVRLAMSDGEADVDDYVAAFWCRIHTYPLASRPHRIAANLALDALKLVKEEIRWAAQGVDLHVMPPGAHLDQVHQVAQERGTSDHNAELAGLTAVGVITAADRLGLIDGSTRAVLLTVYSEGLSGHAAAERHATTPAMIRRCCSKAVRRLAEHAAELAEAA